LRNGYTSQMEVFKIILLTSPSLVTLTVKTRRVKVKGPKGEITKDFRHMPVEMKTMKQATKNRKGLYLNIKMWFGGSKQSCSVATLKSLIRNMVSGVTQVSLQPLKLTHELSIFLCQSNLILIINYEYRVTDIR